jgi:lipid A 3-O-deacylase
MYRLIILAVILSGCSGAWTLKEDNDFFGGRNSDQNYTQGLRVSQDTEGVETYVGQLLYTPANKQLTTYQPNQRPYAGYLYAGQLHTTVRSPNIADTKGLTVGIIGPHAYGEQTQNTVHKWIKNKTAKGWGNQLHDEPAIMGTLERAVYLPFSPAADIKATTGVNIGTPITQGYFGLLSRYGHNLPDWIRAGGLIFPRLPDAKAVSAYVLGGGLVRFVGYNVFLDGNTFRDSGSIDKELVVAEARLGFAVEYAGYKLGFMRILQTREHAGEKHGARFGEIELGYNW